MKKHKLRIGILNLMHDKEDTQRRYINALTSNISLNVEIKFFYPVTHYLDQPVPENVTKISSPLDIDEIKTFDGFIITGFPAEQISFENITFINEIRCLIDELNKNNIEQLYFCWGAMAALNYLYRIKKQLLPEKLFGVYKTKIFHQTNLLNGLNHDFIAPHARYTEMDKQQIIQDPRLQINAETENGYLFLVTAKAHPEQQFLFAHMEYDEDALLKEYQREKSAHPEKNYKKPENQKLLDSQFNWKNTQQQFFNNWLEQVNNRKLSKKFLAV